MSYMECLNPQHTTHGIYLPCGTCFACAHHGRGLNVLHKSSILDPQQAATRRAAAVQPMFRMPNSDEGLLGHEELARIPEQYRRAILDFDLLRRRAGNFSLKGRTHAVRRFFEGFAQIRAIEGKHASDPLLWLLGTWELHRATALSLNTVQPAVLTPAGTPLPRGSPSRPLSVATMAAWSCGLLPGQYEIYEICCQVCEQTGSILYERFVPPGRSGPEYPDGRFSAPRSRETGRNYQFPTQTTKAWIAWSQVAYGKDFPVPPTAYGTRTFHRTRWEEMGLTSDDVRGMARFLPRIWTEPWHEV